MKLITTLSDVRCIGEDIERRSKFAKDKKAGLSCQIVFATYRGRVRDEGDSHERTQPPCEVSDDGIGAPHFADRSDDCLCSGRTA